MRTVSVRRPPKAMSIAEFFSMEENAIKKMRRPGEK
jgi:hypothetical protein